MILFYQNLTPIASVLLIPRQTISTPKLSVTLAGTSKVIHDHTKNHIKNNFKDKATLKVVHEHIKDDTYDIDDNGKIDNNPKYSTYIKNWNSANKPIKVDLEGG